jgi:hypothetical protein
MHAKCVLSLANATLGVIEPSWAPRFLPEVVRGRTGGVLPVPLPDGGLEALSVCGMRRFANLVIFFGHANEHATRAGSCNRQTGIKRCSSLFSCQFTLGERALRILPRNKIGQSRRAIKMPTLGRQFQSMRSGANNMGNGSLVSRGYLSALPAASASLASCLSYQATGRFSSSACSLRRMALRTAMAPSQRNGSGGK